MGPVRLAMRGAFFYRAVGELGAGRPVGAGGTFGMGRMPCLRKFALTASTTGGVGGENGEDTIPNLAEYPEDFFLRPCGVGGIGEGPVVSIDLSGKNWARLVGVSANGNDGFNRLV